MAAPERPLRADAARNRQAIICAAGAVFAQEGTAVTLEHIAEVAGVGVGTIYRRFTSVEALAAVVLEEKMTRYADRSEEAAERALTEPWQAFRDYVMYILEEQAADLAFSDIVMTLRRSAGRLNEENRRAFDASVLLTKRVRAAGVVRPDFDHSDLYLLLQANGGLMRAAQRSAPLAWKRFGEYMLQAFQHAGDRPLPLAPEVWTRAQAAGEEQSGRQPAL